MIIPEWRRGVILYRTAGPVSYSDFGYGANCSESRETVA